MNSCCSSPREPSPPTTAALTAWKGRIHPGRVGFYPDLPSQVGEGNWSPGWKSDGVCSAFTAQKVLSCWRGSGGITRRRDKSSPVLLQQHLSNLQLQEQTLHRDPGGLQPRASPPASGDQTQALHPPPRAENGAGASSQSGAQGHSCPEFPSPSAVPPPGPGLGGGDRGGWFCLISFPWKAGAGAGAAKPFNCVQ